MQKDLPSIKKANVQIVAISYDSQNTLMSFAKKGRISFPLLSDSDSKVIKAYGLLNKNGKGFQAGIPHPGTVLIGQDGKICEKIFYSVRKRHPAKELIAATGKLHEKVKKKQE